MTLIDQLRSMATSAPPGALVSLPVEWLRAQLEEEGNAPAAVVDAHELEDLTIAAAAAKVGRATSTVRGWLNRGLIPEAYRLMGRDWRIPPAALRAFLDRQQVAKPARAVPAPARGRRASLSDWRREIPGGRRVG